MRLTNKKDFENVLSIYFEQCQAQHTVKFLEHRRDEIGLTPGGEQTFEGAKKKAEELNKINLFTGTQEYFDILNRGNTPAISSIVSPRGSQSSTPKIKKEKVKLKGKALNLMKGP